MTNSINYTVTSAQAEGAMAFSLVYSIFYIAVAVFAIVCMWKLFKKAGKPGWASLIPVYNTIVLFQISGMSPWYILLLLVPIANIIVSILVCIKLAKAFGKGGGFAVGLIFLSIVFIAILALGDSEYQGITA